MEEHCEMNGRLSVERMEDGEEVVTKGELRENSRLPCVLSSFWDSPSIRQPRAIDPQSRQERTKEAVLRTCAHKPLSKDVGLGAGDQDPHVPCGVIGVEPWTQFRPYASVQYEM